MNMLRRASRQAHEGSGFMFFMSISEALAAMHVFVVE